MNKKKGEAGAQPDQTPAAEVQMSPEVEALIKKIGEEGDKVRQLKSSGADKVCTENKMKYFHEMIYSVAVSV